VAGMILTPQLYVMATKFKQPSAKRY